MEIEIIKIENIGPTIGVWAKNEEGKEVFAQYFDLPFDETGVISYLQREFEEKVTVEEKKEDAEEVIPIEDFIPIKEEPKELPPEFLGKVELARQEASILKSKIGMKFKINLSEEVILPKEDERFKLPENRFR